MSATLELFERYKLHMGVQADRLAAQMLGVKSQTVSNWRTRGSQAEAWLVEEMCHALHVDVTPWLLCTQMEQCPSARNRQVWRRVVGRLGYPIATIATAIVSLSAWVSCLSEGSFVDTTRTVTYLQELICL